MSPDRFDLEWLMPQEAGLTTQLTPFDLERHLIMLSASEMAATKRRPCIDPSEDVDWRSTRRRRQR